MKQKKKLRKDRVVVTIIPLLLLIVIAGAIKNNKQDNNIYLENEVTKELYLDSNKIDNKNNMPIINTNTTTNVIEEEANEENTQIDETNQNEQQKEKKVNFDSTVAFIGDSRTQGFIMYNGLKKVQDYSYIGLMVDTAISKEFIKTNDGNKITILEDMKNKDIQKVYIMLGLNELGWSYPQVFKLKYGELIDEIRKIKPNCTIYLQSIIPVTESKDKSDKIFNNKNVDEFNKLIQELSSEKNVKYLDVKSALVDEKGFLPEEASTDGIHIDIDYCKKWLDYLKNNS